MERKKKNRKKFLLEAGNSDRNCQILRHFHDCFPFSPTFFARATAARQREASAQLWRNANSIWRAIMVQVFHYFAILLCMQFQLNLFDFKLFFCGQTMYTHEISLKTFQLFAFCEKLVGNIFARMKFELFCVGNITFSKEMKRTQLSLNLVKYFR